MAKLNATFPPFFPPLTQGEREGKSLPDYENAMDTADPTDVLNECLLWLPLGG